MKSLLNDIRKCTICKESLPLGPNPVLSVSKQSKIAVIGQAPGTKVHASGIPWDDPSGKQLRKWLDVSDEEFYDENKFAIVPMGFCYPGKGKSGDLPPRKECAPQWHDLIWGHTNNIELTLLIGQYAQRYYLKNDFKQNLTDNVKAFKQFLPKYFPLPHPSPRNRFWLSKNHWFEIKALPILRNQVRSILG